MPSNRRKVQKAIAVRLEKLLSADGFQLIENDEIVGYLSDKGDNTWGLRFSLSGSTRYSGSVVASVGFVSLTAVLEDLFPGSFGGARISVSDDMSRYSDSFKQDGGPIYIATLEEVNRYCDELLLAYEDAKRSYLVPSSDSANIVKLCVSPLRAKWPGGAVNSILFLIAVGVQNGDNLLLGAARKNYEKVMGLIGEGKHCLTPQGRIWFPKIEAFFGGGEKQT